MVPFDIYLYSSFFFFTCAYCSLGCEQLVKVNMITINKQIRWKKGWGGVLSVNFGCQEDFFFFGNIPRVENSDIIVKNVGTWRLSWLQLLKTMKKKTGSHWSVPYDGRFFWGFLTFEWPSNSPQSAATHTAHYMREKSKLHPFPHSCLYRSLTSWIWSRTGRLWIGKHLREESLILL